MSNLKCLTVFVFLHMSYGKIYEECRGITKSNTVVPSTKSCSKYIFCNGANSYEGECLAGNYFNPVEGTCDDPENVNCSIEPSEDVKSIFDENFKPDLSETVNTENNNDNPDDGDDSDDGDDEDGMDNEQEGDGDDYNVDGGDDNDGDVDGEDDENITDSTTEGIKEITHNVIITIQHPQQPTKCPQTYGINSIKNIPNTKSCVSFFTCYNGIAIPMLCPAKLYFNEYTGKCETQMSQSCKLRHSVHLTCHKGINDFVPHPYRCEYYFYCLNGYLLIMRCPQEFTWNYELRTCVHKSNSNCYFEKSVIYHDN